MRRLFVRVGQRQHACIGPEAAEERDADRVPATDEAGLFTTPGYGDVGLDGNSIAILSRIVTGHGAPLHDKTLMHATMDVFPVPAS